MWIVVPVLLPRAQQFFFAAESTKGLYFAQENCARELRTDYKCSCGQAGRTSIIYSSTCSATVLPVLPHLHSHFFPFLHFFSALISFISFQLFVPRSTRYWPWIKSCTSALTGVVSWFVITSHYQSTLSFVVTRKHSATYYRWSAVPWACILKPIMHLSWASGEVIVISGLVSMETTRILVDAVGNRWAGVNPWY